MWKIMGIPIRTVLLCALSVTLAHCSEKNENSCDAYKLEAVYKEGSESTIYGDFYISATIRLYEGWIEVLDSDAVENIPSTNANVSRLLPFTLQAHDRKKGMLQKCATSTPGCAISVVEFNRCNVTFTFYSPSNAEWIAVIRLIKQGDVLACDNGIPLGYEACYFSAAQDYGTKTSRVYCYSSEPDERPTTAKCDSCPNLATLANTTITADNIDDILQSTLASLNSSLPTAIDLYYSSLIVQNSAGLQHLTAQNFVVISEILDRCLEASDKEFVMSNTERRETTKRFLEAMKPLFLHSPANSEYLKGHHIALAGRDVNCDWTEDEQIGGIADYGSTFSVIGVGGDVRAAEKASVYIPRDVICHSGASKAFFIAYRNPKFFNVDKTDTSQLRNADSQEEVNRCAFGNLLADGRVFTATLLQGNSTISRYSRNGVNQTMVILRYSKKTVRSFHRFLSFALFSSRQLENDPAKS